MIRSIEAFRSDDVGDWVAELSCLHSQHVRHRPPFWNRPWVLTEAERRRQIGAEIECPLCDRAELPDDLHLARTAGPFDEVSLPVGLRRAHLVADRTWAVVRVLEGAITFTMDSEPPVAVELHRGDAQPIPPGVEHALHPGPPVVVAVDFLVRSPGGASA